MFKYILLFFSIPIFSQSIKIDGKVMDKNNRSIERASVVILDESGKTINFTFTNSDGFFLLFVETLDKNNRIVVSSLGFGKEEIKVSDLKKTSGILIVLNEKLNQLDEIIIKDLGIKKSGDTTTIKLNAFNNQKDETLEEVLKKIPGIDVQKDGSIKVRGQHISKLLVEGDDMFNKNYTLLSKNIDAKVFESVQVLENFEDNPILKSMLESKKTALNLKLKKSKQNVWFGNINLGSGVVSENRWKENLSLGLIRKKIKTFTFFDYNNLGDKATDLILNLNEDVSPLTEEKKEKPIKNIFNSNNYQNSILSNHLTVFNNATLISQSFFLKPNEKTSIRGLIYYTKDDQKQTSFSNTIFNFDSNPLRYEEKGNYQNKNKLQSIELEQKVEINEKAYFRNIFNLKNNSNFSTNNILFNQSSVEQNSKTYNYDLNNHSYFTNKIAKNLAMNNYLYFGKSNFKNDNLIISPYINELLVSSALNNTTNQNFDYSLQYIGFKTKIIYKKHKFNYIVDLSFEDTQENISNTFLNNGLAFNEFENNLNLKKNEISVIGASQYKISKEMSFLCSVGYSLNKFDYYSKKEYFNLFNPKFSFYYKNEKLGFLTVSYSLNTSFSESKTLLKNSFLNDFNSFVQGISNQSVLRNNLFTIFYSYLNEEKRFAFENSFSFLGRPKDLGFQNTIDNNFTILQYIPIQGQKSFVWNTNFTNYFKILRLSIKLESNQTINENYIRVNSLNTKKIKGYVSSYSFSGKSYFKLPINIDFGGKLNFFKSNIDSVELSNSIINYYSNLECSISKEYSLIFGAESYEILNRHYSFLNSVISFSPTRSRFSFKMTINNILNQRKFEMVSINNFTKITNSIPLLSRYFLLNVKYRF